jgi:hypothetical protein
MHRSELQSSGTLSDLELVFVYSHLYHPPKNGCTWYASGSNIYFEPKVCFALNAGPVSTVNIKNKGIERPSTQ